MRVLYHHRTQGEEPESVHIANIVFALRALGHEVDLVGPAAIAESRTGSTLARGARLKRRLPRALVELAQLLYNLKSFVQLVRALRRHRYDFIYERYALYSISGVIAARLLGIPLILEVNTLYAQAWGKYYGLSFPRLARLLERFVFRHAQRLITVTGVQAQMLRQEGVPDAAISVCHNAVDPQEFDVALYGGDPLRAEFALPPVIVGFIGTMTRWQGMHGYVDVVRRVAAERDDVGFLFVGQGEGRQALEQGLEQAGLRARVAFAGRQPHASIPRYLATIDIGILLDSNHYGSPMKIFEYWSMNKPIIAPRVPPVLEIMEDGKNGFLIEPGDSEAMARLIVVLAADASLRTRLGAAGRSRILSEHTWERNAMMIVDIFERYRAQQDALRSKASG